MFDFTCFPLYDNFRDASIYILQEISDTLEAFTWCCTNFF